MLTIKRVRIGSAGKLFGALYGFLGLLFGLFLGVMIVIGAPAEVGSLMAMVYGFVAIVFFPVLYGALGYVAGLIFAFLYNFAAGRFGGLEIETE